ncbi:hypothetical protein [Massilia sp. CT11-137]
MTNTAHMSRKLVAKHQRRLQTFNDRVIRIHLVCAGVALLYAT